MLSGHLVHSSAIDGLDQTLYKGSESAAEADNKKATKSYFLRQCARNRRLARRLTCSKMWHTENEWPWVCFMLREVRMCLPACVCACVHMCMCWQNWLCSQFAQSVWLCCYLLQIESASSEPSAHSTSPSQRHLAGRHCPFLQVKSVAAHVFFAV